MPIKTLLMIFWLVLAGIVAGGCAVPQPRGKGQLMYLKEPTTKRGYWLYLPEDYVAKDGRRLDGKKWPLVMSFHGMKPWDNANPQAREWQEEADRYGYVVCAPDLIVCDTLMPFPVREGSALQRDEEAILAIMDDLAHRTDADPSHVLSTSWSSGGFVAHYMVNRHPERFSCLSTRQSNFAEEIMNPKRLAEYRGMPIGLYYTTNDFGVCKRDTLRAIAWYKQMGAANLEGGQVQAFGHERTPEVAADFFARACGAVPKTPPQKLARIRIEEAPPEALAMAAPTKRPPLRPVPRQRRSEMTNYSDSSLPAKPQRSTRTKPKDSSSAVLFDSPPRAKTSPPPASRSETRSGTRSDTRSGPASSARKTPAPQKPATTPDLKTPPRQTAAAKPEPTRERPLFREYKRSVYTPPERKPSRRTAPRQATRRPASAKPKIPISVQVSATLGIAPLLIDYALTLPAEQQRGADFLWFDNDMPIGNGSSGQKVLTHAGEHEISVLVLTKDDQELRAGTKVTVLAPLKKRRR